MPHIFMAINQKRNIYKLRQYSPSGARDILFITKPPLVLSVFKSPVTAVTYLCGIDMYGFVASAVEVKRGCVVGVR